MNNEENIKSRPDWRSAFWRLVYFITGLILLAYGRLWMVENDDLGMLPLLIMVAGMVLVTVGIRQWPRRRKL